MNAAGAVEVLAVFTRLGLTSFGGPIAHLGYFRAEYVVRRRWLDEATYADLVALCQFLPGPASSQVGIGIGILRAGLLGGLAAWVGFTLPSALALTAVRLRRRRAGDVADAGWLHGLKIVAVAVVAQAVWGMARTLCPDRAAGDDRHPGGAGALLAVADRRSGRCSSSRWRARRLALLRRPPRDRRRPPSPCRSGAAPCRRVPGRCFFGLLSGCRCCAGSCPAWPLAAVRQLLSRRLAGLRRRPRRPAAAASRGRAARLGDERAVHRGLRRGAGRARARSSPSRAYLGAVERAAAERRAPARLMALVAIFLPSFLLVFGALPFWDTAARAAGFQARAAGHQRGGGRPPARRALPAGLDQRHPAPGRLRPGAGRRGC